MLMDNEDTSDTSPQPNKKRKVSWITIVFVTVGVIAIGAAILIPQFTCCRGFNYDSDAKANLHNIFLACKAYWADNGSESNCTPTIASGPKYGYIQSADVNISGSGTETDFSATARNNNSEKSFRIDSNGTITEVD